VVTGAFELSKELEVIEMIKTILKHQAMRQTDVEISSELYDDGIGLDSLCVAELSAMLEKAYGSDPYTSNVMPRTVGDIVSFYGDA
jgi:acyl carrier protein